MSGVSKIGVSSSEPQLRNHASIARPMYPNHTVAIEATRKYAQRGHSDPVVEGASSLGLSCPSPPRPLHFPPQRWPFLAVVLVNSVPQCGQTAFIALPLFSR